MHREDVRVKVLDQEIDEIVNLLEFMSEELNALHRKVIIAKAMAAFTMICMFGFLLGQVIRVCLM